MPRTKLLDRGEEIMTVYPEIIYTDSRGNRKSRAGDVGEKIRVTVSAERMSSSDLIGQVDINYVNCIARYVPGWSFARVQFRGEDWDLVVPPHVSSGVSRASRHWEIKIRSRNKLGSSGVHNG